MIGTGLALLGSAALGLGGSIFNGLNQKKASDRAADAQTLAALGQLDLQKQGLDFTKDSFQKSLDFQKKAFGQGLDFTKQTYNQSRLDSAPWLQAGKGALSRLQQEMRLKAGGSHFRADPGYKFQVQEGTKGVLNNLAALGMKNSGSALKALTRFRTGLADQSYGQYYGRLADLAGVGQSQANNNANLGSNTAGQVNNALSGLSGGVSNAYNGLSNGVSNAYQNMGNTLQDAGAYRASGYTGGANAITGMVNGVTNTLGNTLGHLPYM